MLLWNERQAVVEFSKKMLDTGLVKGSGGNISLCNPEKTLAAITPSGVSYLEMTPEDVVIIDLDGNQIEGNLKPSSEIHIHLALLNRKKDDIAVVHTHSDYATAMACLRWELPALHYLIGHAGDRVPVADYAIFGSVELSDNICHTIGEGNAVLMANHGMVAVGTSLKKAYATAEMVEYVAKLYMMTKSVGKPVILDGQEMSEVLDKFQYYGQQNVESSFQTLVDQILNEFNKH